MQPPAAHARPRHGAGFVRLSPYRSFPNRIAGVKLVISAFLLDQLIVGASLNDASLFQNHDTVGVSYSGQTMGDNKACSSTHQFIHTVLNDPLGSGVDGTGRLIQDQYRRVRDGCLLRTFG